jgi:fusaric acid resistance family protein
VAEGSYARRGKWLARFDGGAAQLRVATVGAAAMLLSFGSGLVLENLAHLNADVVFLCVVMSLTLGRTRRGGDLRRRIISLVMFPAAALAAAEIGTLMAHRPDLGQPLFAVAVSLSIWLRRFGPLAARLGTLIALPFVAILVTPVPQPPGPRAPLWAAVAGLIAFAWVWVAQEVGQRSGFLPTETAGRPAAAARQGEASKEEKGWARLSASTRMAAQMAISLGAAFALGRWLFPTHWTWAVLTAFIVNSGNRGRGDVVYKSLLRVVGASVGTVAATLLAGSFGVHDPTSIAVIMVVLAVANWLRVFNYGYWAACVTAVLSLLYGYFGETGTRLLTMRLEEILLGAALGIAVSWLVMPIKTADVVRGRIAAALACLAQLLAEARRGDPSGAGLEGRRRAFEACVEQVDAVAQPLLAHRAVIRTHTMRAHPADAVAALRHCVEPLAELCTGDALAGPQVRALVRVLSGNVTEARRAIGRVPGPGWRPLPAPNDGEPSAHRAAFEQINAALREIHTVYAAQQPSTPAAAASAPEATAAPEPAAAPASP